MNWNHVKLIYQREVRDQLRDRRTMFTIFFLPLLLYPLMGMMMFEVAQFHRESKVRVGVLGGENVPQGFQLFSTSSGESIAWRWLDNDLQSNETKANRESLRKCAEEGSFAKLPLDIETYFKINEVDLVAVIPTSFQTDLWRAEIPLICNLKWERSVAAEQLCRSEFEKSHREWLTRQLEETPLGGSFLNPPKIHTWDIAPPEMKRALIWSKILPFVLLVWALTGAFYPAIDLCAGEKERGTLETLLCSPASRREIVWGKLLTVICFSLGTAFLNLISMYTTAIVVMGRMTEGRGNAMIQAMGPLPIHSIGWLVLLLLPISAMFSALALAVASLARSTKEGQYYLMPLLLVGIPLVMLPMIPGISLTLGTSIIPVTGAVLLVRTLMDGDFVTAALYIPTVLAITIFCCLLAVRWAVRQFESESVMFRDSARSSIKHWLRDAWRQRETIPTANESILCGLLILVCLFFGRLSMASMDLSWDSLVRSTLVIQLGMMLGPALIMATILTRSVMQSLRLRSVKISDIAASGLLAIALHPSYVVLATIVSNEYKLGEQTTQLLQQFDGILSAAPIGMVIVVLALIPAISEELVFRGFLFAGLERNSGHVRAILLSSILFGLSHGVLQQTITASLIGLLLGWIAYRTGGVACTIIFHFVHNALSMTFAAHGGRGDVVPDWMTWAVSNAQSRWVYTDVWATLSVGVSISLIAWIAFHSRSRTIPSLRSKIELPNKTLALTSATGVKE